MRQSGFASLLRRLRARWFGRRLPVASGARATLHAEHLAQTTLLSLVMHGAHLRHQGLGPGDGPALHLQEFSTLLRLPYKYNPAALGGHDASDVVAEQLAAHRVCAPSFEMDSPGPSHWLLATEYF